MYMNGEKCRRICDAITFERMIYMFTYKTNGTCSTQIDLEIQDGVITYCKSPVAARATPRAWPAP